MKVMKRKLLGLSICLILVATIPLAAGVDVAKEQTTDEDTGTNDGFFGYTLVRGWVLNPKEVGTKLTFRAIRLHYTEFTGTETSTGILRGVKCELRTDCWLSPFDGNALNFDLGPLGTFRYTIGFYKGGITE